MIFKNVNLKDYFTRHEIREKSTSLCLREVLQAKSDTLYKFV